MPADGEQQPPPAAGDSDSEGPAAVAAYTVARRVSFHQVAAATRHVVSDKTRFENMPAAQQTPVETTLIKFAAQYDNQPATKLGDAALCRKKVPLTFCPTMVALTSYMSSVKVPNANNGSVPSGCVSWNAINIPPGGDEMEVVTQLITNGARTVPNPLHVLLRDLSMSQFIGGNVAATSHHLFDYFVTGDGNVLSVGKIVHNMKGFLSRAGLPISFKELKDDYATDFGGSNTQNFEVNRVWALLLHMINLPERWAQCSTAQDYHDLINVADRDVIEGVEPLPSTAVFHSGLFIGAFPSGSQVTKYFELYSVNLGAISLADKAMPAYIERTAMVFPPSAKYISTMFRVIFCSNSRSEEPLSLLARAFGCSSAATNAGTMHHILAQLLAESNNSLAGFGGQMIEFLVKHAGVPREFYVFKSVQQIGFRPGQELNRLWRLFNVVLEYPRDFISVDNRATVRAIRRLEERAHPAVHNPVNDADAAPTTAMVPATDGGAPSPGANQRASAKRTRDDADASAGSAEASRQKIDGSQD